MNQLSNLVNSLSIRQRVTILVVALAVVAGLVSFSRWRREGDFRPLYQSLAAEDAGAIVQKLKESGVEYRLAENGGTVLVPSARTAESRLALAAAGLPKSGRIGFELFDKTNLGATEFAEHINFHRALEGELERSVMCLGEVELARIHVTFSKESLYTEERQPAKASVLVRLKPDVIDLCRAHLLALEAIDRGISNQVFNLGNGNGFSVMDVIRVASKASGKPVPYHQGPRRPGDVATVVASSEKAQRMLEWKPAFDLEAILKSEWERSLAS